jgi:hypothetical protein
MRSHPQDLFPPPVAKVLKSHSPSESNRIKDEAGWSMQARIERRKTRSDIIMA